MATEEDLEKKAEEKSEEPTDAPEADAKAEIQEEGAPEAELEGATAAAPMQLGYMRFVYGAYMGGAMIAAFLAAKIGHVSWYKLGQWKPELGEPKDEILYPVAALLGVLVSVYYWRKQEARKYAIEVAEELSKVTWPNRKEVTNSTAVVVATTVVMTVFFALMDQFWRYVTDKIYSW